VTRADSRIDAQLLGRIVLARFLELPLRSFSRVVMEAEASIARVGLARWVVAGQLRGSRFADNGEPRSSPVLADVVNEGGTLRLDYRRESYIREFAFNEAALMQHRQDPDFPVAWSALLSRLRLINTRNRLTHAIARAMLTEQAGYLRSGNALRLVPFTQAMLSARLRSAPDLVVIADAGRISRLVRAMSIALPGGQVVPFGTLFPKPRQIHRHLVECVIREEKNRMLHGELHEPLSDKDITHLLQKEYGVRLLRRTVASIRHDLAIPDYRNRCGRMGYVAATEGFSALVPLTAQTLRSAIPAQPGIYEIRATATGAVEGRGNGWVEQEQGVRPAQPHVLYIGSSGDLRKRLGDHLRGSSDNMLLFQHIARGAARVRYCVVSDAWRAAERKLYEVFCTTFGGPPPCNRMSP